VRGAPVLRHDDIALLLEGDEKRIAPVRDATTCSVRCAVNATFTSRKPSATWAVMRVLIGSSPVGSMRQSNESARIEERKKRSR
jgi:hypothetical protein